MLYINLDGTQYGIHFRYGGDNLFNLIKEDIDYYNGGMNGLRRDLRDTEFLYNDMLSQVNHYYYNLISGIHIYYTDEHIESDYVVVLDLDQSTVFCEEISTGHTMYTETY